MEQIGFQGYARAGGFDPVKVSDANVQRILQQGERTIRGMKENAAQDLQNRAAYLAALQTKQSVEQANRKTNFDSKTRSRKAINDARVANFETQASNELKVDQRQADLMKSLSSISATAGKIAGEIEKGIGEQQEEDYYNKTLLNHYQFGSPADEQLEYAKNEHMLRIAGESIEVYADAAAAKGVDPLYVENVRKLNRYQQRGRDKALQMIALEGYEGAFAAYRESDAPITIPDENGGFKTIKANEATTSAEVAAAAMTFMPEYLKQNGLYGKNPIGMNKLLLGIRTINERVVSNQRKLEAKVADQERLGLVEETFGATRDPIGFQEYYKTLTRSINPETGQNHTPREARAQAFKFIATQVGENNQPLFSATEREAIYDTSFDDQPGNPISKRYATEIYEAQRLASKAENQFFEETERSRDLVEKKAIRFFDDEWIKNWDGSQNALEEIISEAGSAGQFALAQHASRYLAHTNEAQDNKAMIELFNEELEMGALTVERVLAAKGIDAETRGKYIELAKKAQPNALSEDQQKAYKKSIELALRKQSQDLNLDQAADRTLPLAELYAWSSFQKDYQQEMLRTNGDRSKAYSYAMGRFESELQKEQGLYSIVETKVVNGQRVLAGGFRGFQIEATATKPFAMTYAREALKSSKGAALDSEALIDKATIEEVLRQVKQNGRFSLPPQVKYLSDQFGGKLSVMDILNRQAKYHGLEQIPLKYYESNISKNINPAHMQLMNYMANSRRYQIATIGSGTAAGYAPTQIRRGNAAFSDITMTLKAAGFEEKDIPLFTALAMAESSGNQRSKRDDTDVHGLWQIRFPVHVEKLRAMGITSREQLYDPMNNAKAALAILRSQGLGAWEAYTEGAYKQYLPQAEAAMRSYGQGPWRQGSNMNTQVIEYITGDRSHPNYRSNHGGSNYHEHLAFQTRQATLNAAQILNNAGIQATELKDVNPVGGHSDGSYHYRGLAFDVPASQVPVGQEQDLSRRVRQLLGIN